MKPYLTILKKAEYEYIINKSRFISVTAHVSSKEEAEGILAEERLRFPDATHHCWAYILDQSGTGTKFSDDGEPSGTAGMPILEVMRKQGLSYCITVVTRYFGGILLGAGGLVRAYTNSTVGSVKSAGIAKMEPCEVYDICIPYTFYDKTQRALSANKSIMIFNTEFSSDVRIKCCNRIDDTQRIRSEIFDLCNGNATFTEPEQKSCLWPEDIN